MDYGGGKKRAVTEGTKSHNKFDLSLKKIIRGIGLILILGAATVGAWQFTSSLAERKNQPPSVAIEEGQGQQASNVSAVCSGEIQTIALGSEPVVINPGGRCIVKWRVDEGRVNLIDQNGNCVEVGPEGGSFDTFWTESVKASTESASMHYKLVTG